MSLPLILGCVWIFGASVVATLPMRLQFPPGIVLLIAAPILIGWTAMEHGIWIGFFGLFAFVSMFRRPLGHLFKKIFTPKEAAQ